VKKKENKKETAATMATKIREISISEFFAKNRHLLGFDNPLKALLTTVREGVDNSLDACEEASILPEITVKIIQESENLFKVSIEDNGPGIVKTHLPNIFGKLLYGSKFHRLKQSRGQQGIGISAAVMYGQMTTGKPSEVISKTGKGKTANCIKLQIDTKKNTPQIVDETVLNDAKWQHQDSGTRITISMEASYKEGRHGVLAYMSQTALSNPHANIIFVDPKNSKHFFPRLVNQLPEAGKEIKPHPHGMELGSLIQMLNDAKKNALGTFLKNEFSRVTEQISQEICKTAGLKSKQLAASLTRNEAEKLYSAIQKTKLLAPPTNCLSPMGENSILKALYWLFVASQKWDSEEQSALLERFEEDSAEKGKGKKGKKKTDDQEEFEFQKSKSTGDKAEENIEPAKMLQKLKSDENGSVASKEDNFFVTAVTRSPSVYRGNPFQVEVGLFYGKGLKADSLIQVYRYANRVPLLYQAAACAMTKAAIAVPWKTYGLDQSRGALPTGPVVLILHIASVWVPYTSESKEAIAHYPEIIKELKLALFECGRRLQRFLRHRQRQADEFKKRSYIEKYLNPIGEALQDILDFSDAEKSSTLTSLKQVLEKSREKILPEKNVKRNHFELTE